MCPYLQHLHCTWQTVCPGPRPVILWKPQVSHAEIAVYLGWCWSHWGAFPNTCPSVSDAARQRGSCWLFNSPDWVTNNSDSHGDRRAVNTQEKQPPRQPQQAQSWELQFPARQPDLLRGAPLHRNCRGSGQLPTVGAEKPRPATTTGMCFVFPWAPHVGRCVKIHGTSVHTHRARNLDASP